jgi:hypothetical protein
VVKVGLPKLALLLLLLLVVLVAFQLLLRLCVEFIPQVVAQAAGKLLLAIPIRQVMGAVVLEVFMALVVEVEIIPEELQILLLQQVEVD